MVLLYGGVTGAWQPAVHVKMHAQPAFRRFGSPAYRIAQGRRAHGGGGVTAGFRQLFAAALSIEQLRAVLLRTMAMPTMGWL